MDHRVTRLRRGPVMTRKSYAALLTWNLTMVAS